MIALPLSEKQVWQLIEQLPLDGKRRVLRDLQAEQDSWWQTTAQNGEADMRRLALERGKNWDNLNEGQRESFVDCLLHEYK